MSAPTTSTTTWADIRKLAVDLQRVQLAETSKRLTDANCVEIVSTLMSMGMVDLVISSDGKEYITRKHLQTECANECLAATGRIALTDLAAQLNVNLDHINTAVSQLLRNNQLERQQELEEPQEGDEVDGTSEFIVCARELIHRNFIKNICARLDASLQEFGHISMLQLTRQWELPTELLNQHILPQIGTHPGARIAAIRFEDQLFTLNYIGTLQDKLRAILIAITHPTPLNNIFTHLGISQSLFFKLWNELADGGKLPGRLLGSKNSLKALYVPNIHERLAKQYVKQRLAEDYFFECSILKRLSIAADPVSFFRELLPANNFQDLLFWPSVVLSESQLWRECHSLSKNLLQSNHFCSLEDILPLQFTFLTDEDYAKIVERLQEHGNGTNLRATDDRSVVFEHPQILQNWLKLTDGFVRERALKDAPELRKAQLNAALAAKQKPQQQKVEDKDDWKKPEKAGKKGGKTGPKKGGSASAAAGGLGRGGKQQKGGSSADLKPAGKDALDSAQISLDELLAELIRSAFPSGHTKLPSALWDELKEEFATDANKLYRTYVAEAWQQLGGDQAEQQEMRKAYEQKLSRCADLYAAICMFEKGTDAFEEPLCTDLRQYLLRSLCTEMAQLLLLALADPISSQPVNFSGKYQEQLISSLESAEMQKWAKQLFNSLDTLENFHDAIQRLGAFAGFMLKQSDKKERSERLALLGNELQAQLSDCSDPPTILLLAVLLSFQRFHGIPLHASGKFVSSLIAFLCSTKPSASNESFPPEIASTLNEAQRLVVTNIKHKHDQSTELQRQLTECMERLKGFLVPSE